MTAVMTVSGLVGGVVYGSLVRRFKRQVGNKNVLDSCYLSAHKIQVKKTTQSLIQIVAISLPGGWGQVQFRPLQHRLHRSPPLPSSPRHLRPHPPLRLSLRLLRRLLLPALPRAGCRGRLPPGPGHIRGGDPLSARSQFCSR